MDAQYKIIGGDGAEYGPVALTELNDWIRDGRVAATTQVWRDDLLRWTRADRYQELQPELTRLYAGANAIAQSRLRPAGFWARLAAATIDRLLVIFLFLALWKPLAEARHWQVWPPDLPETTDQASVDQYRTQPREWINTALPVFLPIFMLYEVLMNGSVGATLGKMAIGARVTELDGTRISYARALLLVRGASGGIPILHRFPAHRLSSGQAGVARCFGGTKVVYVK